MVAHIYNPSYSGRGGKRIKSSGPVQAKLTRPYLKKKKKKTKGLEAVAQVAEH
jgi:hypothetical protein